MIAVAVARRIAVVLFNLGGPDSLAAVEPFLKNLFSDPAIITLPGPLRWLVARWIARRRAVTARGIYAKIENRSPILPNTEAQAAALGEQLRDLGEVRVYCAMRYWHPMSDAVAAAVKSFAADEIVLLPLYPQFSSTTTGSSYRAWIAAAADAGVAAPTKLVCCYPTEAGFVAAAVELIRLGLAESAAKASRPRRLLFSAHGLPKKIVKRGDPYPSQVGQSARAIAAALGLADSEWTVCFQSRVGPLEWIGPYTDDEIRRAGRDGVAVVLFPIAFVSEHSETLVELDIDYRHIADHSGVPSYVRVPTVGTTPAFIAGLAELVRAAVASPAPVRSQVGRRLCAVGDGCCVNPVT
ncbi:MAG TPA: ferrochelatase [Candidatus Angelobacter sp.]|nr:ferrochelatase [Candidatus Angelobacter sp.]